METDKAYLAGFIDGEATLTIREQDYLKADNRPGHRSGYRYHYHHFDAQISIKHTSRVVLDFMEAEYGGSVRGPFMSKTTPNSKPFYIWTRYLGSRTMRLLDDIEPYVKLKCDHIRLIRALMLASTIEEKRALKDTIKALNQRGQLKGKQLPLTRAGV